MASITRRSLLGAAALAPAIAATRPNIILLVADDLGYADLGCYGNRTIRTPNLDKLAAQGMRFTDFYVSWPACTPSRSSILTGRYPQRNGLYDMIRNDEVNWGHQFDEASYAISPEMTLGMDLREITIGQMMKTAGYATGAIGKWDGGRARRFLPLQRGFDFYYGFANTGIDYYTHERYGVPSLFRGNQRVKEEGHATDLFQREAVRFIDENHARPFFLYFAPNAPHSASTFDKKAPQVPEEYLRMYADPKKAQYFGLVTQLDAAVGAILDAVRKHQLEENTLVVFISDNGGSGQSNGPLRGGKTQMFEGGIRVPMIARWPGRIRAGAESRDFVVSMDLLPTLLAAAGGKPPKGLTLDGFNVLPALEGRGASRRKECFWQRRDEKAARVENWKWIETPKMEGLFDLTADLGEQHDLSKENPARLAEMRGRWAAWRKEMDHSEPRGPFQDY